MNESESGLCSLKTEYRDQSNILNMIYQEKRKAERSEALVLADKSAINAKAFRANVKTSEVARLVNISFGYKQAIINLPEYATLCIGMSANPQEARQSG